MSAYINGEWDDSYQCVSFESLKGKVLTDVIVSKDDDAYEGGDRIEFITDIETFVMLHEQDCCENVFIESALAQKEILYLFPEDIA